MVSRDFMVGDMVRLPLGDNSVNEIWLENVLSLIEKGQEIIIKELLRVLKRRGRIYVIEYYTPKKIKKYLEEYDFLKDGAEIKIYSGGEMFIKMSSEGLSKDDLRKVAFHCTNMERDGVASIIDVFLAEITKNN
jgi:ubiquinone/menaquinone biosynthesis C-methylase UbiE